MFGPLIISIVSRSDPAMLNVCGSDIQFIAGRQQRIQQRRVVAKEVSRPDLRARDELLQKLFALVKPFDTPGNIRLFEVLLNTIGMLEVLEQISIKFIVAIQVNRIGPAFQSRAVSAAPVSYTTTAD